VVGILILQQILLPRDNIIGKTERMDVFFSRYGMTVNSTRITIVMQREIPSYSKVLVDGRGGNP
jgi:hypothetical protein